MDDLYNYRFNCVNVSAGDDQYIKDWVTNDTIDGRIEIFLNSFFPHAIYIQLNSSSYQWCGPFVLMAKRFTEISRLR